MKKLFCITETFRKKTIQSISKKVFGALKNGLKGYRIVSALFLNFYRQITGSMVSLTSKGFIVILN